MRDTRRREGAADARTTIPPAAKPVTKNRRRKRRGIHVRESLISMPRVSWVVVGR